jgi:hypothetical protein
VAGVRAPAQRRGPAGSGRSQAALAAENFDSDYRLTPEQAADIENAGPRVRARNNLEAISTVKPLEKENRRPTLEEQANIARYVGWGATEFSQGVLQRKPEWAGIHDELQALLTPEEFVNRRRAAELWASGLV